METMARGFVKDVSRFIMEEIADLGHLNVSDDCTIAMLDAFLGLKRLDLWAVQMADANGKIPSGLLVGTLSEFGSYDECLNIKVDNVQIPFTGRHCLLNFRPSLPEKPRILFKDQILDGFRNYTPESELFKEMVSRSWSMYTSAFTLGICVPSACNITDVEQLISQAFNQYQFNGQILNCDTKDELFPFDNTMLVISAVLGSIIILVFLCTIVDIKNELTGVYKDSPELKQESLGTSVIKAASLRTNWIRLFSDKPASDRTLSFLNGMRSISMLWIIVSHTYMFADTTITRNNLNKFDNQLHEFSIQVLANGHYAVLTFLFITGLLMSYALVKAFDTHGSMVFNVPLLLTHRWLRLVPMTILAQCLMIIMPYYGSGPLWYDHVIEVASYCRKNWWQIPLSVNNYVTYKEMCLLHTWYISLDMQLFAIGLVYFAIYFKNPKLGTYFSLFIVFASISSCGLVTYVKEYPPVMMPSMTDIVAIQDMVNTTHYALHSNMTTYAISLIMGSYLARFKEFKISKLSQIIGWSVTLVVCTTCVLIIWLWDNGHRASTAEAVFYASFHRTLWSLGLCWITLMCATGRGGLANRLLSWTGFNLFNRISFLVYLTHVLVSYFYMGNQRGTTDSSHVTEFWLFCGHLLVSCLVSFVLTLLFEGPLMAIKGVLLNPKRFQKKILPTNITEKNGTTKTEDSKL